MPIPMLVVRARSRNSTRNAKGLSRGTSSDSCTVGNIIIGNRNKATTATALVTVAVPERSSE